MSGLDPDDDLVAGIRTAYDASARSWSRGPATVYRCLAAALVGSCPDPLDGQVVLDLGAGTGVASEELARVGARSVQMDLAHAMLSVRSGRRPPATVADARRIPYRDDGVDAVVSAFCLNHLPDPAVALAECRRVTRPGGLVLASTYPLDAEHPAKAAVEQALVEVGYQRPDWYRSLKARAAPHTGDPESLTRCAATAGLVDIAVDHLQVDAGVDVPAVAVDWRLDMPHTAGFVAGLDPDRRRLLHDASLAALEGELPSTIGVLVLRARSI